MKATQTDNYIETQRELAAGVLKQARQDLRRFCAAPSAIERELYLDAYRWIMSDDFVWPFSFLNVCRLLNLVPEDVRDDLTNELSVGPFSRWIAHCNGALQRLRALLGGFSQTTRVVNGTEPTTLSQPSH